MTREAELIGRFYQALAQRDHATMGRCYVPDARFSDPVFPDLRGPEVPAMWRMLCERATDLRIEASAIRADARTGSAHCEAWYPFSATRRRVHNIIDAEFEFQDGLIVRHRDQFDLYRWARHALGFKGILLGWAPPVQRAIRRQGASSLAQFQARERTGR